VFMLDVVTSASEAAVSELADPSITPARFPPTLICHNGSTNVLASRWLISVTVMTV
jgi:hypothetical protein